MILICRSILHDKALEGILRTETEVMSASNDLNWLAVTSKVVEANGTDHIKL